MRPILYLSSWHYYFIIIIVSFCSCNNQPSVSNESLISNLNTSDSFVKDIPLDLNDSLSKKYMKMVEKNLKLSILENGFDSIQIRIWYGYSFFANQQLVVLKCQNLKWTGEFYNYTIYYTPDQYNSRNALDYIDSVPFSVSQKEPVSGWNNLIHNLFKLQILSLPDDSLIKGYEMGTDGGGVVVEIATKNFYKIYGYSLPSLYRKKIKEAAFMQSILILIQREFYFKQIDNL